MAISPGHACVSCIQEACDNISSFYSDLVYELEGKLDPTTFEGFQQWAEYTCDEDHGYSKEMAMINSICTCYYVNRSSGEGEKRNLPHLNGNNLFQLIDDIVESINTCGFYRAFRQSLV